jgi:hypothetical protein
MKQHRRQPALKKQRLPFIIRLFHSRRPRCLPQAEERLDLIMNQPAQREGMTEALKAADQMEWVHRMNSIRARAEEIVLSELVYC